MALANLGGAVLCWGEDHVQLGCHDLAQSPGCGDSQEPESTYFGPVDQECVDLSAPNDEVQPQRTFSHAPILLAVPLLLLPDSLSLDTSRCSIDLGDDPPPSFCARSFTCSIVIRC